MKGQGEGEKSRAAKTTCVFDLPMIASIPPASFGWLTVVVVMVRHDNVGRSADRTADRSFPGNTGAGVMSYVHIRQP